MEISRRAVEGRRGVGSSDLEALRELDTTLFGPDQEAIASDSDVASADTLSSAKRVDRSVDDDEYFSNVNIASPAALATESTDDLELAAIAADVLEPLMSVQEFKTQRKTKARTQKLMYFILF